MQHKCYRHDGFYMLCSNPHKELELCFYDHLFWVVFLHSFYNEGYRSTLDHSHSYTQQADEYICKNITRLNSCLHFSYKQLWLCFHFQLHYFKNTRRYLEEALYYQTGVVLLLAEQFPGSISKSLGASAVLISSTRMSIFPPFSGDATVYNMNSEPTVSSVGKPPIVLILDSADMEPSLSRTSEVLKESPVLCMLLEL